MKLPLTLKVNGVDYPLELEPATTLLDAVRDGVGLTGSKEGCNNGNCGACSVLLDGRLVNSCLVMAAEVEGSTVTTVEGLAPACGLSPVQEGFHG